MGDILLVFPCGEVLLLLVVVDGEVSLVSRLHIHAIDAQTLFQGGGVVIRRFLSVPHGGVRQEFLVTGDDGQEDASVGTAQDDIAVGSLADGVVEVLAVPFVLAGRGETVHQHRPGGGLVAGGVLEGGDPYLSFLVLDEPLDVYVVDKVRPLHLSLGEVEAVESGALGAEPNVSLAVLSGEGGVDVPWVSDALQLEFAYFPRPGGEEGCVHVFHKQQHVAVLEGGELRLLVIPLVLEGDGVRLCRSVPIPYYIG